MSEPKLLDLFSCAGGAGMGYHRAGFEVYGNAGGTHEWPAAMGIDWMTNKEMAEAIPPSYSEHLGRQLIAHIKTQREAA